MVLLPITLRLVSVNQQTTSFPFSKQNNHKKARDEESASQAHSSKLARDGDSSSPICPGYGRRGHVRPACIFTTSKYYNKGNGKYLDSTAYASHLRERPNHKDTGKLTTKSSTSSSFSASASATASQKMLKRTRNVSQLSRLSFLIQL